MQVVVDYPFNEFLNDETFEVVVGQTLMIPDGVMPQKKAVVPRATYASKTTPDAGTVTATGNFCLASKWLYFPRISFLS